MDYMSLTTKVKRNPMYICMEREIAESYLSSNICKVPNCTEECIAVFQSKKAALNSMRPLARQALKNSDCFRFMVFGLYFSEIAPLWCPKEEYKGESIIERDNRVLSDIYVAKNDIPREELFMVESWCLYKDKSKKLRYHRDYKMVDTSYDDIDSNLSEE